MELFNQKQQDPRKASILYVELKRSHVALIDISKANIYLFQKIVRSKTNPTCTLKLFYAEIIAQTYNHSTYSGGSRGIVDKVLHSKLKGYQFKSDTGYSWFSEFGQFHLPRFTCVFLKKHCSFLPGTNTIKKNKNSTQNKSKTQRARAYTVTSCPSTDCELSTETWSKKVDSIGLWCHAR